MHRNSPPSKKPRMQVGATAQFEIRAAVPLPRECCGFASGSKPSHLMAFSRAKLPYTDRGCHYCSVTPFCQTFIVTLGDQSPDRGLSPDKGSVWRFRCGVLGWLRDVLEIGAVVPVGFWVVPGGSRWFQVLGQFRLQSTQSTASLRQLRTGSCHNFLRV